jgi:hypothetical protein
LDKKASSTHSAKHAPETPANEGETITNRPPCRTHILQPALSRSCRLYPPWRPAGSAQAIADRVHGLRRSLSFSYQVGRSRRTCHVRLLRAADFYLETGDRPYLKTLEALWPDLSQHQLYITGGVRALSDGEAFGEPYELPNARAYGESCAAIGNMMWNWRMLHATGESRFADVMERALYNGINSGMSLDGTLYCYRNPLAFDPSTGDKIRHTWYDTTWCTPNLERTLASLPGYFYSTSKEGIYLHLYDNANLHWHLKSGYPS